MDHDMQMGIFVLVLIIAVCAANVIVMSCNNQQQSKCVGEK